MNQLFGAVWNMYSLSLTPSLFPFRKEKLIGGNSLERALEDATSATDMNLNVPTRLLQEIADHSFNQ